MGEEIVPRRLVQAAEAEGDAKYGQCDQRYASRSPLFQKYLNAATVGRDRHDFPVDLEWGLTGRSGHPRHEFRARAAHLAMHLKHIGHVRLAASDGRPHGQFVSPVQQSGSARVPWDEHAIHQHEVSHRRGQIELLDHCLHSRRFGDVNRKLVVYACSTVEFVWQVVAKGGE